MKTTILKSTVLTVIAALFVAATGQAQIKDKSPFEFKYKSAEKAFRYSFFGTLIPVATGVAWWALDKSGQKTMTYGSGYNGHSYTYTEDPDRTIPIALMLTGVMVGPSLGYYYGGCPKRGTVGLCIRIGTGIGTVFLANSVANAYESDQPLDFSGVIAGLGVIVIGSGVILLETIVDIGNVQGTVDERNYNLSGLDSANVTILPMYFADFQTGGLQLNVTF